MPELAATTPRPRRRGHGRASRSAHPALPSWAAPGRAQVPPWWQRRLVHQRIIETAAAKSSWLIRAWRWIRCTIDPLIHHQARIHRV